MRRRTRSFAQTRPFFSIRPSREIDGRYLPCRASEATLFFVEQRGEPVQGFDTYGEAHDFVSKHTRA